MLLKREREDTIMEEQATKALPPGLAPPGQQHSWSVIKQHLERIRDFVVPPLTQIHDPMDGLNSPLLSPDAFDVGFSSLLFRSQGLSFFVLKEKESLYQKKSFTHILFSFYSFGSYNGQYVVKLPNTAINCKDHGSYFNIHFWETFWGKYFFCFLDEDLRLINF